MGKYDETLTIEYLTKRLGEPVERIAIDVGCSTRTIYNYLKKYGLKKSMKVVDKYVPPQINDEDYINYHRLKRVFEEANTYRQSDVTIIPPDQSKYLGIAVIGDLHFMSDYTDEERLRKETELIEISDDVIMVQLGDVTNSEASFSHRGMNRTQPREAPLDQQRLKATTWFKRVGDKMAGFIIGNHDWRAIVTESFDIGNGLATKINGAYLGYAGTVHIKFSDKLTYNIYLTHGGKGYSMYHPCHPAIRILMERPHLNLDIVCHGDIHDAVAFEFLPYGDRHALLVRSGGYKTIHGEYAQQRDFVKREVTTPLIILHPTMKSFWVVPDLEWGIKLLNLLNKEIKDNDL